MKLSEKLKTLAPKDGAFNEAALLESVTGFVEQVKAGDTKALRITDVTAPPRLPARSGAEVRRVRESLNVSQSIFASYLNVPTRTVISWENGQRKPSGAALKLLDVAEHHPEALGVDVRRTGPTTRTAAA